MLKWNSINQIWVNDINAIVVFKISTFEKLTLRGRSSQWNLPSLSYNKDNIAMCFHNTNEKALKIGFRKDILKFVNDKILKTK